MMLKTLFVLIWIPTMVFSDDGLLLSSFFGYHEFVSKSGSVCFCLDNSCSMFSKDTATQEQLKETAHLLVDHVDDADSVFVFQFNSEVNQVSEVSRSSKVQVLHDLENFSDWKNDCGTKTYKCLDKCEETFKADDSGGEKLVVLFSDGCYNDIYWKYQTGEKVGQTVPMAEHRLTPESADRLKESGVKIFGILIGAGRYQNDDCTMFMERLTSVDPITGSRHYMEIKHVKDEKEQAFEELIQVLEDILSYRSYNEKLRPYSISEEDSDEVDAAYDSLLVVVLSVFETNHIGSPIICQVKVYCVEGKPVPSGTKVTISSQNGFFLTNDELELPMELKEGDEYVSNITLKVSSEREGISVPGFLSVSVTTGKDSDQTIGVKDRHFQFSISRYEDFHRHDITFGLFGAPKTGKTTFIVSSFIPFLEKEEVIFLPLNSGGDDKEVTIRTKFIDFKEEIENDVKQYRIDNKKPLSLKPKVPKWKFVDIFGSIIEYDESDLAIIVKRLLNGTIPEGATIDDFKHHQSSGFDFFSNSTFVDRIAWRVDVFLVFVKYMHGLPSINKDFDNLLKLLRILEREKVEFLVILACHPYPDCKDCKAKKNVEGVCEDSQLQEYQKLLKDEANIDPRRVVFEIPYITPEIYTHEVSKRNMTIENHNFEEVFLRSIKMLERGKESHEIVDVGITGKARTE